MFVYGSVGLSITETTVITPERMYYSDPLELSDTGINNAPKELNETDTEVFHIVSSFSDNEVQDDIIERKKRGRYNRGPKYH